MSASMEGHLDRRARRDFGHLLAERFRIRDFFPIQRDNDISRPDAPLIGRASGLDRCDENPLRHTNAQAHRNLGGQLLNGQPQPSYRGGLNGEPSYQKNQRKSSHFSTRTSLALR